MNLAIPAFCRISDPASKPNLENLHCTCDGEWAPIATPRRLTL